MHLLTRLDANYEYLVTNLLARLEKDNITIEDVYSLMLSHETRLKMNKGKAQSEVLHNMSVNFAKKRLNYNKSSSTNKRSFDGGNIGAFDNNRSRFITDKEIICQICFIHVMEFTSAGIYLIKTLFLGHGEVV